MLKSSGATRLDERFFGLQVVKLVVETKCKTFETDVVVKLGGIELKQNYRGNEVRIVTTRHIKESYLFTVEFLTVSFITFKSFFYAFKFF